MVSTKPSLAQFISLFTTGKMVFRSSKSHIRVFTLRFLSRQKVEKKLVLTNKFFFVTLIESVDCVLRENLPNRSSGIQIPRDICTRFGRYLYSTKCSWKISNGNRTEWSPIRSVIIRVLTKFFITSQLIIKITFSEKRKIAKLFDKGKFYNKKLTKDA